MAKPLSKMEKDRNTAAQSAARGHSHGNPAAPLGGRRLPVCFLRGTRLGGALPLVSSLPAAQGFLKESNRCILGLGNGPRHGPSKGSHGCLPYSCWADLGTRAGTGFNHLCS